MKSLRKAAVLMLSLEKPLAAEVMSQLPKDHLEQLTMELAKVDDVTVEEQDEVLGEFAELSGKRIIIERGGLDFADELLKQSVGEENATMIIDNVRRSLNSVPFGFLQKAGVDNLLTFIQEEHPQTIALIMSHLPNGMAAEVLSGLAPTKQLEVVRRIANMEQTSPQVVQDVEASLRRRMMSTFSQQAEVLGGVPMVAQILNVADRMAKTGILESPEQDDADLVEEIQRLMFVFEDLIKLDNNSIQTLLKVVDNSQWALALKGASNEIRQKILGNLSQRASEMLKEEMEYLGPVKISDVEGMQKQIVDTVRRLETSGEITVASGGDGDQFVT